MTSFWPVNIGGGDDGATAHDDEAEEARDDAVATPEGDTGELGDENAYDDEGRDGEAEDGRDDAVGADDATAETDHPTDDGRDESKTQGKGRGRAKTRDTVKPITPYVARKIGQAYKAVETESGLKVAQILLGTGGSDPANIVAQLSEKRNRNRIASMVETINKLDKASQNERNTRLTLAFNNDREFARTLFLLLNAIEPERGFGRFSGDIYRDVDQIVSAWGDGVDLSVIGGLSLD